MGSKGKTVLIAVAALAALTFYGREQPNKTTSSPPKSSSEMPLRDIQKQTAPSAPIQPQRPVTTSVLPDPTGEIAAPAIQQMVATARVRMRAQPNSKSEIVLTLEDGQIVDWRRREGAWHEVAVADQIGWVHGKFLSDNPTQPNNELAPASAAQAARIVRAQEPAVEQSNANSSRSGQPVREPYTGRCDCPYDVMRNGRECGGRSAYSKPGGRNPVCYF